MLILSISILLIYSAWARGGTVQSLQILLPILAGAVLVAWAAKRGALKRALRDPVCWTGLLFLLLLAVQWWNAGRVHFFDPFGGEWGYTVPRIPWLPAAFTAAEAAEMLRWFFPAWALLVAVRAGELGARGARRLLQVLAVNGAVLAVFGMVQQLSGTNAIFWLDPLEGTRFFASFGYENHAGSYFVLTAAIAIGLLLEQLFADREINNRLRLIGAWTVVMLLNFAGANLSHSRAGIILAWVLAFGAFVTTIYYAQKHWRFGRWVDAMLAAIALAVIAGVFVLRLGGPTLREEVASIDQLRGKVGEERSATLVLGDRIDMAHAAIGIWQDYPFFGSGGWGFRYLMPYELPADDWQWASQGVGKANVHNDGLQFLAEFGMVGFGLMLVTAGLIIAPIARAKEVGPLASMALLGCLLVAVHSFIDLPFRCPAILYAWLTALAGAPLSAEVRGERGEV